LPTGELRIACTVTACHSILPKLLAQSRTRFPKLHLQISTSDATRCLQRLRDDEVDVAVLPVPETPDPNLKVSPLTHTELSFIAPANDKALQRRAKNGGAGWDGLPMVLPRHGLERERIDAWLSQRSLRPEIYAEVDGNEAILAMVSLGCGVGVVPELVREGSPLKRSVVRVNVPNPPRGFDVALCAKQRALERRAVSAFWSLADGTPGK
jgi:LysR family positive regulator for ilvC